MNAGEQRSGGAKIRLDGYGVAVEGGTVNRMGAAHGFVGTLVGPPDPQYALIWK